MDRLRKSQLVEKLLAEAEALKKYDIRHTTILSQQCSELLSWINTYVEESQNFPSGFDLKTMLGEVIQLHRFVEGEFQTFSSANPWGAQFVSILQGFSDLESNLLAFFTQLTHDYDGVPITGSHYFLTELLRQEYGFKGYVVSDSDAVEYLNEKQV